MAVGWCRARHISRSACYEISLYGDHHAAVLARSWRSKMQFLYNQCRRLGDDLHDFSDEEKAAWPEPSDLTLAERELASVPRARARIQQIRNLG